MALTLGEQLDEVQLAISQALKAQSYQNGDKQISRAALSRLEDREQRLQAEISVHGRNYIPGQNTTPKKAFANVIFS